MGIKQLYNDNLRKLPNEYGDVSVMHCSHLFFFFSFSGHDGFYASFAWLSCFENLIIAGVLNG